MHFLCATCIPSSVNCQFAELAHLSTVFLFLTDKDHMTSSQYRSEGQQWASSPPLPHSSSCLAPLALVKLLCWALRLVAENRRGRRFGVTSSPQLYKRLLVPMPACTWTRMLIPRQHSVHAHRHTTFKKKNVFACAEWQVEP